MAGRKSDFTLTRLDDLFTTQAQREEERLSKIRDIPLELIDDFPDHPFKVRDDEDMQQLVERSTFYYHFSDIYDVLDGVVQAKIDEFNEEYNGEMDKVLMKFIEYSIIHRKVWANLFDARGREWLEKYVKTRIHYLALLQIRKMSEGYILSIKDVEIICSFYEEAIFGLLIRWIIKEEKAKTVDEIKDTVERIEKLFEGQLDLIISNMKK